jgi:hypothetical protein
MSDPRSCRLALTDGPYTTPRWIASVVNWLTQYSRAKAVTSHARARLSSRVTAPTRTKCPHPSASPCQYVRSSRRLRSALHPLSPQHKLRRPSPARTDRAAPNRTSRAGVMVVSTRRMRSRQASTAKLKLFKPVRREPSTQNRRRRKSQKRRAMTPKRSTGAPTPPRSKKTRAIAGGCLGVTRKRRTRMRRKQKSTRALLVFRFPSVRTDERRCLLIAH